jgi:hypothetical protein
MWHASHVKWHFQPVSHHSNHKSWNAKWKDLLSPKNFIILVKLSSCNGICTKIPETIYTFIDIRLNIELFQFWKNLNVVVPWNWVSQELTKIKLNMILKKSREFWWSILQHYFNFYFLLWVQCAKGLKSIIKKLINHLHTTFLISFWKWFNSITCDLTYFFAANSWFITFEQIIKSYSFYQSYFLKDYELD